MSEIKARPTDGSIISVVGVGGAGGNAVNHMWNLGIRGVKFMVCNTDQQALDKSPVELKIRLGSEGLGAGNDPENGRRAAVETLPEIRQQLEQAGTRMIFITAGMGGGTGTGASPVIAKLAKEMGLLTVAIACVINIVGDLVLVGVFHLGAAGAAIATVTAQAVSVIVSLVLIRRKELPFAFHRFYVRFDPVYVRAILRVGIPIALQELLVQFSFLFIQVVVNGMGVTQSAAVGVAEKAVGFLMLVGSAYMQSISAFVAQNNGAGQYNRSKKALFYGIETAFAAGVVMAALAFFGGGALASLFSREAAVIAGAHEYLKAYAFDCLLTAIFFCYVGYFNGCGKTIFVMAQGVIGAFCVRVPAVFLLSRAADASLFRIGLATPLSSLVQIFLCLGAYRYYQKKGLGLPTEARQID